MSRHGATLVLTLLVSHSALTATADAGINKWTSNGPYGGFMESVAVDPSQSDTVYAGAFDGRLFKSTDAGANWSQIADLTGSLETLVVDPSDSNVVYAGTLSGLFKSTDSGDTWPAAQAGLIGLGVRAIAVDPLNGNTLYAGTQSEGIFKSADAGASWNAVSPSIAATDVRALVIDASNPNVLLAATADGGVFKTSNAGVTWAPVNQGLTNTDVRALAMDASEPDVLYAATRGDGVFKSVDGGANWTPGTGLGGFFVTTLVIDPLNPQNLFAGTESDGVFRSFDGAATWAGANTGLEVSGIRELAINPENPNVLYSATFGGDGLCWSSDAAATWETRNSGINSTSVEKLVFDPLNPNTLYAATFLDGIFKSSDAGATWTNVSEGLDDLMVAALAVDPVNPNVLYAGTAYSGIFKSQDGGTSWTEASSGLISTAINDVVIDPLNPNTIYAATMAGVYKSTDRGSSWDWASTGLSDLDWDVEVLVVDPNNPNVLYAGSNTNGVFRSTDASATWTPFGDGLSDFDVEAMAFDATAGGFLYAATFAGIFRAAPPAAGWTLLGQGPDQVETLAIDPTDPATLYAGTLLEGVFKSRDSGTTWTKRRDNLAGLTVRALAIDPVDPGRVYAGTFGAAVFEITQRPNSLGGRVWHDLDADGVQEAGEEGLAGITVWLLDENHNLVEASGTDSEGRYSFPYQEPGNYVIEVSPDSFLFSPSDQGPDTSDSDVDPSGHRTGVLALGEEDVVVIDAGLFRPAVISGRVFLDGNGDGIHGGGEPSVAGVIVRLSSPDSSFRAQTFTMDFGDYGFGDLVPGRYRARFFAPEGTSFSPRDQGGDDTVDSDADAGGLTSLIVLTSGSEAFADAGVVPDQEPDGNVLELQDGRFTVEVTWRDFQGTPGRGTIASVPALAGPVPLRSQDSSVLRFFGRDNWEVLLKILDARALNGRFWVFYAAATNVEFTVRVTDTRCGDVKSYTNASGVAAPAVTDTSAFSGCAKASAPSCKADENTVCLGEDGRFEARVDWRDFAGQTGQGSQVLLVEPGPAASDDSGLFYFFTQDNWELLVKVLDGCSLNDRFWVFSAATTNVEYTLKVTDRASGQVRTYTNPLGVGADALNDTSAFATCGVPWP